MHCLGRNLMFPWRSVSKDPMMESSKVLGERKLALREDDMNKIAQFLRIVQSVEETRELIGASV